MQVMPNAVEDLKKRILPVLSACQSNKGDLILFRQWSDDEGARKKLFYAYYSGLFCRILFLLESESYSYDFIPKCEELLKKYNWFDVKDEDLDLFTNGMPYDCEVPEAMLFIDGFDNLIKKDLENRSGMRMPCYWFVDGGAWSYADVRGSAKRRFSK